MSSLPTNKLALLTATVRNGWSDRESAIDKATALKRLHTAVSACHEFIYDPQDAWIDPDEGFGVIDPDKVDWPFPVVSFEVAGDGSSIFETEDGAKLFCILADSRTRTFWFLAGSEIDAAVAGKQMTLTHLRTGVVSFDADRNRIRDGRAESSSLQNAGICAKLLDILSKEQVWKKHNGGRCISYRKPGNRKKKIHIPKPYVYIVGRKPSGGGGGSREPIEMEWTHRWSVRGHWRARNGFGKNPMGVYNQQGRTWIPNHVRGPVDKPLVEKRRIVKCGKAGEV